MDLETYTAQIVRADTSRRNGRTRALLRFDDSMQDVARQRPIAPVARSHFQRYRLLWGNHHHDFVRLAQRGTHPGKCGRSGRSRQLDAQPGIDAQRQCLIATGLGGAASRGEVELHLVRRSGELVVARRRQLRLHSPLLALVVLLGFFQSTARMRQVIARIRGGRRTVE